MLIAVSTLTAEAQRSYRTENSGNETDRFSATLDGEELLNDSIYIPESLEMNVDSLLQSWHFNYYTKRDDSCLDFDHNINPHDSIYVQRLSRLPHIMEMTYNEPVKNCIKLYTERRRKLVQYMLGLADFYFPMIERILDENGLPLELKYLAIIESALNPTALSRAGASGLWQFMLPTGKIYNLEINSLVDERLNPEKATYAACRYLKDMYAIYGDWNLVIASYNCGPGNVNKAIRRAGGKKDYWAIYDYLPRETRSYVPLFIAASYVMNYHCEHNICPVSTSLPLSTDTVMVDKLLHLEQVAQVLKIDLEQLKVLNPEYKRNIVPGNYKPCALRLPTTYTYAFIEAGDALYEYRKDEFFQNRAFAGPGATRLASSNNNSSEKITHRVAKGETMLSIANHYGVTTAQIRKWNNLRSTRVAAGKRLVLYVDNGGVLLAKNTDNNNTVADNKPAPNTGALNTKAGAHETASYKKYKVRKGDTLSAIAKKYPGVNARDLMKMNNLRNSSIKVGQVIKIPIG